MYNPQRTLVRLFGGKSKVEPASLISWQLMLAGLLAVQGLALLLLSTAYELPVYVSHLTGDVLQTKLAGQTQAALAVSELFHINLPYYLAAMLFVTALLALLVATVFRESYVAMVKRGWAPLRWVTIAFAGGFLFGSLSLLAGVYNFGTLVMIVLSAVMASAIALTLEQLPIRRRQSRPLNLLIVAVTAVLTLLPLCVILLTLIATNVFGSVAVPGYVWWLFATTLAGIGLIGANAHLTLTKWGKWSNYAYGESWFIVLTALMETIFVWQVFAAVLHA